MSEWTTQLSFSFRHLLKQRGMLAAALLLSTLQIALLVSANRLDNFADTWFGLLHVQMILLILLTPILFNAVWSGRVQVFESKTILYYLRRTESYFLARMLTVWLVLAGSVIVFDTGFWLLYAREADSAIWAGAVLQILLTVGYVTALSGFFSLMLRRTIYSLLPLLIYLLASLSLIEHPMFALWFSPNLTEQVTTQPEQIAARSVLMIWILLLMIVNAAWFRRRTVR
ncbi:hypothetical protein CDO73_17955 [Saccharibacillus sp. O23]|uniref:hypothetical protein n=1 Tax=Saccharibacillus sp. O23 TaxID=2009338 RepID=UPI000B4E2DB5|nr:hypothetical protein [Saccharibacillus sp. O23]OWR28441.1 hypothetical protein CDO73_17955 [Saccharibacillus sp. O23]